MNQIIFHLIHFKNLTFQEERERRVLKNTISKVFQSKNEKSTDIFQKDEAEEFLAQEIGLTKSMLLPAEGKEACSLVGFHRFALMIIGSKVCPKSNQEAWTWETVLSYLRSIRIELKIQ